MGSWTLEPTWGHWFNTSCSRDSSSFLHTLSLSLPLSLSPSFPLSLSSIVAVSSPSLSKSPPSMNRGMTSFRGTLFYPVTLQGDLGVGSWICCTHFSTDTASSYSIGIFISITPVKASWNHLLGSAQPTLDRRRGSQPQGELDHVNEKEALDGMELGLIWKHFHFSFYPGWVALGHCTFGFYFKRSTIALKSFITFNKDSYTWFSFNKSDLFLLFCLQLDLDSFINSTY